MIVLFGRICVSVGVLFILRRVAGDGILQDVVTYIGAHGLENVQGHMCAEYFGSSSSYVFALPWKGERKVVASRVGERDASGFVYLFNYWVVEVGAFEIVV